MSTMMVLVVLAPVVLAFLVVSIRNPMGVALPAYAAVVPFGSGISVGLPGPFGSLSSLLGLVLAVAMAAQLVTGHRGAVRIPGTVPVWLGFLGLCAASIFWSIAPQATAGAVAVLASLVLLYVLLAINSVERAVLTRVENAMLAGGVLSASYGLAQLLLLGGLPVRDAGTGGRFGNDLLGPNNQAASLLLPLAIALSRIAIRSGRARLAYVASVALLLVGILLTGSRGGLVAAVLTCGVVTIFTRRGRAVLIKFAVAAAVGLLVLLAVNPGGLGERQVNAEDTSGRTEIWAVGVYACQTYCLTGSGWGTFPRVYALERAAVLDAAVLRRGTSYEPHNIWLLAGLEAGFAGLLLVGLALALTLRDAFRLPADLRAPPLAGMVGIVISGFFLSDLEFKFFWVVLIYVVLCKNCAASEANARDAPAARIPLIAP